MLGATDEAITLERSAEAVESTLKASAREQAGEGRFAAIPEFAAQIAGYVRSPRRTGDLHALIDIGAGTVDIVTFNVAYVNDEDLFPIFDADVRRLGTHYLLASRAETIQKLGREWRESDARLSTSQFANLYQNPDGELIRLAEQFAQELASRYVGALRRTRSLSSLI
jgi:hypothetical protein